MVEQKENGEEVKNRLRIISLLTIGLGVGWLAGLSVSPVATILISGLLGVAIAIVGILSVSLKYQNDKGEEVRRVSFEMAEKIFIGRLALIVLGIALGASLGICARTHKFLGSDVNGLRQELSALQGHCGDKKWSELGIDKKVLARRILDKYYPEGGVVKESVATDSGENKGTATNQSGLYSSKRLLSSECKLLSLEDNLKDEIPKSFLSFLEGVSKNMNEDQLKNLVDNICNLLDSNKK